MRRSLPKPTIDIFSLLRHEDNRIGTYDRVGALLYDIDNFRKGKSPGPGEYFASGASRPSRDIMTRQELKDAQIRYVLKPRFKPQLKVDRILGPETYEPLRSQSEAYARMASVKRYCNKQFNFTVA